MTTAFTHSQATHTVLHESTGAFGSFEHHPNAENADFSHLRVVGYNGELDYDAVQCAIEDNGAPFLRVVAKPGVKVLVLPDGPGDPLLDFQG